MSSKAFYEKMYAEPTEAREWLPRLQRLFKRYLTTRYEMAEKLSPGGKKTLDIACGEGELMVMLSGKYQEVWGVDLAEPRVNRVKEMIRQHENIHVGLADADKPLDFASGTFDTVTAIAILEHVFDPYAFIAECHRLLVSGGTLVLQVPNLVWLPNRLRVIAGRLPVTSNESGWDGGHLHYFTPSTLKKLVTGQGFNVDVVTSSGVFARFRRFWGSMLGPDIVIVARKQA